MALAMSENKYGMIDTVDIVGHDEKSPHIIKSSESFDEIKISRKQLWKTRVDAKLLERIKTIHGYSGILTKKSNLPKFDFFYIDASHFYDAIKNDFFILVFLPV